MFSVYRLSHYTHETFYQRRGQLKQSRGETPAWIGIKEPRQKNRVTCGLGLGSTTFNGLFFWCHFWGQSPADKFVSVTDDPVVDNFGVSFSLGGYHSFSLADFRLETESLRSLCIEFVALQSSHEKINAMIFLES